MAEVEGVAMRAGETESRHRRCSRSDTRQCRCPKGWSMNPTVFLLALALPLTAVSRADADPVTITGGFLLTEGWNVVSRPSTVSGTDGSG